MQYLLHRELESAETGFSAIHIARLSPGAFFLFALLHFPAGSDLYHGFGEKAYPDAGIQLSLS